MRLRVTKMLSDVYKEPDTYKLSGDIPADKKLIDRSIELGIERAIEDSFMLFLFDRWLITSGDYMFKPYQIKDRPYIMGLLEDEFPYKVIMKSAQVGVSEIFIARAVYSAIYGKKNVLYTMPAGAQMEQFVDARIRPVIMYNEKLRRYITGNLNLKKFSLNNRQIYFRGVMKRRQIITVDVGVHIADEIDEYEEGTLYTLTKRLGASKYPERYYFSTPRFHSSGIALLYHGSEYYRERGSDGRKYGIKCSHCGKWNENITWHDNVIDLNEKDKDKSWYKPNACLVCSKCKRNINPAVDKGQWIIQYEHNSDYCHGYHIHKLIDVKTNLNQLMIDSRNPLKEQEFYNSDLGLAYEPIGARLTDAIIGNAKGDYALISASRLRCSMGVDVGSVLNYVITTRDENHNIRVINAGIVDDFTELRKVMNNYNLVRVVVDGNPEKNEVLKLQDEHPNVYIAYYTQQMEKTPDKYSLNEDKGIIHLNRTLMMMIIADMIKEKSIILPSDISRVNGFIEQLKAPVKAQKQDAKGDWITFYPRVSHPDHYYHALLYSVAGWLIEPKPLSFRIVKTMLG